MHRFVLELATQLQNFIEVPGDGLALAIRVSRQVQRLGFLQRLGDGLDVAFIALDQLIIHREAVVGVDRAFLRHQIAHVAIGGQDLEILAQVFLDGSGFGRRFDDYQIVSHATTIGRSQKRKTADKPRVVAEYPDPGSMRVVMRYIKYQIFHPRIREFLTGLAG
jgi:hypothetical protein